MKKRRSILRRLLWWGLPAVVLCVTLVSSLIAWVLLSPPGTRLALHLAVAQIDGQIEDVEGTLWDGLRVGRFAARFPGMDVDVRGITLKGEWRFLLERQVWVRELSADSLSLALWQTPGSEQTPPPKRIELPVDIRVDRLALGQLLLLQQGVSLPVELGQLQASLAAGESVQLRLARVEVRHAMAETWLSGEVNLRALAEPWPMQLSLQAHARGVGDDSPLCLRQLPGRPADAACEAQLGLSLDGSLAQMQVALQGNAPGLALEANTEVSLGADFPLRQAALALTMADGSAANLRLALERHTDTDASRDRLHGTLEARRLDLALLSGGLVPPGRLSLGGGFDVSLRDQRWPENVDLQIEVGDDSRWNGLPLSGRMAARADFPWSDTLQMPDWRSTRLSGTDIALRLGPDNLRLSGAWGMPQAELKLDLALSRLSYWWPGLPGAMRATGALSGTMTAHRLTLDGQYAPDDPQRTALGEAPVQVMLDLTGGWGNGAGFQPTLTGWRGTIRTLRVQHAGLSAEWLSPMTLAFLPDAVAPQWQWQLGATSLRVGLPRRQRLDIESMGARGGGARWQTAGRIDAVPLNEAWLRSVLSLSGNDSLPEGVSLLRDMVLQGAWDLRFDGNLGGEVSVSRRSGDLLLPGSGGKLVGLQDLALRATLTPGRGSGSQLHTELTLGSQLLGGAKLVADTVIVAEQGVPALDPEARITASVRADDLNLSWVNLFAGDAQEVQGILNANLEAQGSLAGPWKLQGGVTGEQLRVVRIDDGIRLLDGTLALRVEDDVVIIDRLRFPAVQRVTPSEWRTRTWITEEADAQNGYLDVTGRWQLLDNAGQLRVMLHRYPIVQRTDRYTMFSGEIGIEAALPKVDITGSIVADAGWISAEMLSAVPTLDDDVHIVSYQTQPVAQASDLQLSLDLLVDLGPRFYLTGMGIDSGLVGSLRLVLRDGLLSGAGTLRTRGGRFEAYGQRLQLTRGSITFQGQLENPLLDIEALRRGEMVEAGVKVTGTAQRPRINLVSYPNVSEVEKLSWLILGRGPDQSGNDTALLLAVGASMFSGGTPMYKQFGLDDVAIKSGAIGSSGSLLPDNTVASQVVRTDDSAGNQFLVATKHFSDGLTLTVEQALSGSGLVARLSYLLSHWLSADLRVGEVNGLGLTYRRIFLE